MFFCSPRFELPMGASEQPPLPQQNMNQTKVRGQKKKYIYTIYTVQPYLLLESHFFCTCFLSQPVPILGRSSVSLIQLTNSSPAQRQQNHSGGVFPQNNMMGQRGPRPLDQVTCYKVSHQSLSKIQVTSHYYG